MHGYSRQKQTAERLTTSLKMSTMKNISNMQGTPETTEQKMELKYDFTVETENEDPAASDTLPNTPNSCMEKGRPLGYDRSSAAMPSIVD